MSDGATTQAGGAAPGNRRWAVLLPVIVALAAHWRIAARPFLWDDHLYIQQLRLVGWMPLFQPDIFGFLRPGKLAMFNSAWALLGDAVAWWQGGLLLLLVTTVVALHELARRLFGGLAALVATCLYAASPVHVEGAGWFSAANGTAMTLMAVLFYLAVLHVCSGRRVWSIAAALLLMAAALLREDAFVLPFTAALLMMAAFGQLPKAVRTPLGALMALAVVVAVLPRLLAATAQDLDPIEAPAWVVALGVPGRVLQHLYIAAQPFTWHYYDRATVGSFPSPWEVIALLLVIACGAVMIGLGRGNMLARRVALLMAAFAIALLPMMNVLPLGNDLVGVRYLTHGGLFLGLAMGLLVDAAAIRKGIALKFALAVCFWWLPFAIVYSNSYHRVWADELRFFEVLAARNDDPLYHEKVAEQHYQRGQFAEMLAAADRAEAAGSDRAETLVLRGMAQDRLGLAQAALLSFGDAARRDATNGAALVNLADALERQSADAGQPIPAQVMELYTRATNATNAEAASTAYVNLGIVHAQAGRLEEAEAVWAAGLARFPGSAELAQNLAIVRRDLGRTPGGSKP